MSNIFITIGLPASGKTTWAKSQNMDWHSSDAIREEFSTDNNETVFGEMKRRAIKSMDAGRDCIYDATSLSRKSRADILEIAKKRNVKRVGVMFLVPVSECRRRNSQRERRVPRDVFTDMMKRFDVPLIGAEFDEIIVKPSGEIGRTERRLLSEDYVNGMEQMNPHHNLTVGEHEAKALALFEKWFPGEYPEYVYEAVRNHDIGKPFTFTFGEDEKGHFYGHEHAGAYWYLVKNVKNQTDWEEHRKTAVLINWHMRPYVWEKSDRALIRDLRVITKYDPNMYGELVNISRADRKAH